MHKQVWPLDNDQPFLSTKLEREAFHMLSREFLTGILQSEYYHLH